MNNLQDLMAKLAAIEESTSQGSDLEKTHEDEVYESDPQDDPLTTDPVDPDDGTEGIEECGGDMDGGDKQVSMSMQDLVALIHGIQKGSIGGDDQDLFGGDGDEVGEEYGNAAPGASDQFTAGIDAVTATGNDMHSKGGEAPKVNGGGNPLQARLAELYAQIKESPNRVDIPAVQRKAQAQKQGYKDTWKVTKKEMDADEKHGKISHPDNLAKNSLKEANEIARKLRKL